VGLDRTVASGAAPGGGRGWHCAVEMADGDVGGFLRGALFIARGRAVAGAAPSWTPHTRTSAGAQSHGQGFVGGASAPSLRTQDKQARRGVRNCSHQPPPPIGDREGHTPTHTPHTGYNGGPGIHPRQGAGLAGPRGSVQ